MAAVHACALARCCAVVGVLRYRERCTVERAAVSLVRRVARAGVRLVARCCVLRCLARRETSLRHAPDMEKAATVARSGLVAGFAL